VVEREDYLVNTSKEVEVRKVQAQTLRDKGLSYREIALELGVSVASVFGYLKTTYKIVK
jgi:predicted transcriptional regulator